MAMDLCGFFHVSSGFAEVSKCGDILGGDTWRGGGGGSMGGAGLGYHSAGLVLGWSL